MRWGLLSLNCKTSRYWKAMYLHHGKMLLLNHSWGSQASILAILKNYRPVRNLPFVSKIAEKAVIDQLMEYCTINNLLPDNQSSCRKHHTTDTAPVKVHNNILASMDNQEVTFLILLNLSASFDTINHCLMMDYSRERFWYSRRG